MRKRTELGTGAVILRDDESYTVVGITHEDLVTGVALLGPLRNGKTHAAYTDWRLDWSHGYARQPDGWHTTEVTVTATVGVTLPRWHGPGVRDPALVVAWEKYLRALEAHEDGHVALVPATVLAARDALRALPAAPTRKELDALALAAVDEVVEQHHARDAAYDREHAAVGKMTL